MSKNPIWGLKSREEMLTFLSQCYKFYLLSHGAGRSLLNSRGLSGHGSEEENCEDKLSHLNNKMLSVRTVVRLHHLLLC